MDYYTFKEAFTYGDTSTLYEKKFSYNRWPVLRVTLQLSQVDNIFLVPRPSFPLGDLDNAVSQGQAFLPAAKRQVKGKCRSKKKETYGFLVIVTFVYCVFW